MITTEDKDFLLVLIDINKCISENDTALAESICEKINAMELNEDQINSLNDTVVSERFQEENADSDAYRIFVEKMDCIKDKDYKLYLLDASLILHSKDMKAINDYLDQKAIQGLSLKTDANQFFYAKILLTMCYVAKRYDKMEEIRAKLKEVV